MAPGKFEWKFRYVIFKRILVIDGWGISCEIALIWMSLGLHWWSVNTGSGNGLVPSGNKPLPEPMLTQISRHLASQGHNEFTVISNYIPNFLWDVISKNLHWSYGMDE